MKKINPKTDYSLLEAMNNNQLFIRYSYTSTTGEEKEEFYIIDNPEDISYFLKRLSRTRKQNGQVRFYKDITIEGGYHTLSKLADGSWRFAQYTIPHFYLSVVEYGAICSFVNRGKCDIMRKYLDRNF